MQLVRYNPFRELLDTEKEINRLLNRGWSWMPSFIDVSTVDMYVEKSKLFIEASMPQFKKDEIKVNATDDGLEISAEHEEKEEKGEKEKEYTLRESSQSYLRQLSLPEGANKDEIKCTFKDGKLTITMPVKEQAKTKTIKVE